MNYEETLDYLFNRLPVFQRIGAAAYRKDLRNTIRLATMTDNPENSFKSIHIAGTNGKGSTAHGLASVFQACGYKVGLMTSPHYKDFRERIRINGKMIPKEYVQNWVKIYRADFERIEPSFFELTVMMGFSYFKEKQVDIAIIETGMGGRLDSTNIVNPEVSVITPIGMDHKTFLGDSIDAIALEKAGIIKQGIPVVLAEQKNDVQEVFESVAKSREAEFHPCFTPVNKIHTDLRGAYQQQNMATVLKTVEVLKNKGWSLPDSKVVEGLNQIAASTGLVGRWQELSKQPRIIADSAHNPPGIEMLVDSLDFEKFKELHVVIGMVSDKDVDAVLSLLPLHARYYFCQAKVMRAISCDLLAQQGMRLGLIGECYGSVPAALTAAKDAAKKDDLILVTGSVFTVAEAL